MDSVPATPDQATKNATTARIIAHVRHGWPHLDDVVITFRGQFCYVALPGPRRARWRRPTPPAPVLRLRYGQSGQRAALRVFAAGIGCAVVREP